VKNDDDDDDADEVRSSWGGTMGVNASTRWVLLLRSALPSFGADTPAVPVPVPADIPASFRTVPDEAGAAAASTTETAALPHRIEDANVKRETRRTIFTSPPAAAAAHEVRSERYNRGRLLRGLRLPVLPSGDCEADSIIDAIVLFTSKARESDRQRERDDNVGWNRDLLLTNKPRGCFRIVFQSPTTSRAVSLGTGDFLILCMYVCYYGAAVLCDDDGDDDEKDKQCRRRLSCLFPSVRGETTLLHVSEFDG
jgi:hypothetical protein